MLQWLAEHRKATSWLAAGMLTFLGLFAASWMPEAMAAEGGAQAASSLEWGYLAAALAVGLACVGAGIAVAHVGASAIAALSEKPQMLAMVLVFVGLAEGIAIYGLIIAIMIMARL